LRLCLVSPYDPSPPPGADPRGAHVGGVERTLLRLAEEVAARGHEVTLLSSSEAPGVAWEDGLRHVRLPRRGTALRAPLAAFARHLPHEAELVHVPATYPFTTGPVLRAAAGRRKAAVLDFHFEPDPGTPVGRLAGRAFRLAGPRAYARATLALVRSVAYARSAPSLRAVPASRWRVVPNGVDARRFQPHGKAAPGAYVLFVGRLVPYKGVEVLLSALSQLHPAPPLVVAGDGPLRARLESQAARLGVEATFLGRVPDRALPPLYRGARLTVLPSVNRQEAFGICLIESMACGTPVVASRLPGVAEVASLGGVLAPPGDAHALARAVLRGLEMEALPRGPPLARAVAAAYDWPVVTERLLDAYRDALGEGEQAREVLAPAHPRRHAVL
jgi:glycosyltransferase involved in cell wall biosynthesis